MGNPDPQSTVEPQPQTHKNDEALNKLGKLLVIRIPESKEGSKQAILQLQTLAPHCHMEDDQKADHVFYTSKDELVIQARHCAKEIMCAWDFWEEFHEYNGKDICLVNFAFRRLKKIGEIIGEDSVDRICEDVDRHRFQTRIFEVPRSAEHPPAPEAKVYYTTHARIIVFHHSRAGLRPMPGAAQVPGNGWCWQLAEDFKALRPVKECGFTTAEVALAAAQKRENHCFLMVWEEHFTGINESQLFNAGGTCHTGAFWGDGESHRGIQPCEGDRGSL